MSTQEKRFIVVFDDQQGMAAPFGYDQRCEGALCCYSDSVALFESRKQARAAINISAKFAALCKAQGKPVNTDFIGESLKNNIRIIQCELNKRV